MKTSPITFCWENQPDLRLVTIRTRRDMRLQPIGEDNRHVDAGEEVTIQMKDFRHLDSIDCEIIGIVDPGIVDHSAD